MTTFVFANNVSTTLASPITSTATSITLSSSANLPSSIPSGDYFALTLNDAATGSVYEIVYATAISGASLTVVRAQEGTTAAAWLAGDYAFSGPTAGQMESFDSNGVQSIVAGTNITVNNTNPQKPVISASVSGGVTSFNTRTGAVTLDATDVDTALGYTAANDAAVVHLGGAETITGYKIFDSVITGKAIGDSGPGGWSLMWNITQDYGETDFVNAKGGGIGGFNWYNDANYAQSHTLIASLSDTGNFNALGGITSTTGTFSGALTSTTGTFSGALTSATYNATSSDRRLKTNILPAEPRPLHRSIPLVSYTMKASGWCGLGSIAQTVKKVAPEYVGEFEQEGKKYLSLNYAGIAHETSLWAAREVDRLRLDVEKLKRELARAKIKPRERGLLRRILERIL